MAKPVLADFRLKWCPKCKTAKSRFKDFQQSKTGQYFCCRECWYTYNMKNSKKWQTTKRKAWEKKYKMENKEKLEAASKLYRERVKLRMKHDPEFAKEIRKKRAKWSRTKYAKMKARRALTK